VPAVLIRGVAHAHGTHAIARIIAQGTYVSTTLNVVPELAGQIQAAFRGGLRVR
jgi:hypothetical protein